MKIYLAERENKIAAYTSLKRACKDFGVSYNSASRGKRAWQKGVVIITITEVELIKKND